MYLPSECCRLVLGFCEEKGFHKTVEVLLQESHELEEVKHQRKKGKFPDLQVGHVTLSTLLQDYSQSKNYVLQCKRDTPQSFQSVPDIGRLLDQLKAITTLALQKTTLFNQRNRYAGRRSQFRTDQAGLNHSSVHSNSTSGLKKSLADALAKACESTPNKSPNTPSKRKPNVTRRQSDARVSESGTKVERVFHILLENTEIQEKLADNINQKLLGTNEAPQNISYKDQLVPPQSYSQAPSTAKVREDCISNISAEIIDPFFDGLMEYEPSTANQNYYQPPTIQADFPKPSTIMGSSMDMACPFASSSSHVNQTPPPQSICTGVTTVPVSTSSYSTVFPLVPQSPSTVTLTSTSSIPSGSITTTTSSESWQNSLSAITAAQLIPGHSTQNIDEETRRACASIIEETTNVSQPIQNVATVNQIVVPNGLNDSVQEVTVPSEIVSDVYTPPEKEISCESNKISGRSTPPRQHLPSHRGKCIKIPSETKRKLVKRGGGDPAESSDSSSSSSSDEGSFPVIQSNPKFNSDTPIKLVEIPSLEDSGSFANPILSDDPANVHNLNPSNSEKVHPSDYSKNSGYSPLQSLVRKAVPVADPEIPTSKYFSGTPDHPDSYKIVDMHPVSPLVSIFDVTPEKIEDGQEVCTKSPRQSKKSKVVKASPKSLKKKAPVKGLDPVMFPKEPKDAKKKASKLPVIPEETKAAAINWAMKPFAVTLNKDSVDYSNMPVESVEKPPAIDNSSVVNDKEVISQTVDDVDSPSKQSPAISFGHEDVEKVLDSIESIPSGSNEDSDEPPDYLKCMVDFAKASIENGGTPARNPSSPSEKRRRSNSCNISLDLYKSPPVESSTKTASRRGYSTPRNKSYVRVLDFDSPSANTRRSLKSSAKAMAKLKFPTPSPVKRYSQTRVSRTPKHLAQEDKNKPRKQSPLVSSEKRSPMKFKFQKTPKKLFVSKTVSQSPNTSSNGCVSDIINDLHLSEDDSVLSGSNSCLSLNQSLPRVTEYIRTPGKGLEYVTMSSQCAPRTPSDTGKRLIMQAGHHTPSHTKPFTPFRKYPSGPYSDSPASTERASDSSPSTPERGTQKSTVSSPDVRSRQKSRYRRNTLPTSSDDDEIDEVTSQRSARSSNEIVDSLRTTDERSQNGLIYQSICGSYDFNRLIPPIEKPDTPGKFEEPLQKHGSGLRPSNEIPSGPPNLRYHGEITPKSCGDETVRTVTSSSSSTTVNTSSSTVESPRTRDPRRQSKQSHTETSQNGNSRQASQVSRQISKQKDVDKPILSGQSFCPENNASNDVSSDSDDLPELEYHGGSSHRYNSDEYTRIEEQLAVMDGTPAANSADSYLKSHSRLDGSLSLILTPIDKKLSSTAPLETPKSKRTLIPKSESTTNHNPGDDIAVIELSSDEEFASLDLSEHFILFSMEPSLPPTQKLKPPSRPLRKRQSQQKTSAQRPAKRPRRGQ